MNTKNTDGDVVVVWLKEALSDPPSTIKLSVLLGSFYNNFPALSTSDFVAGMVQLDLFVTRR